MAENGLVILCFSQIKKSHGTNLSGQNPGATSSLGEVFSSLVRLRRDESASVFWEDKFVPRDYYNVKNINLGCRFPQRTIGHVDFLLEDIESAVRQVILQNRQGLGGGRSDNDFGN